MKRRVLWFCTAILLIFCACAPKEEKSSVDLTPGVTAEPINMPERERVEVSVDKTVAAVFPDTADTSILYGGVAYTNTGNCPITVIGASFSYNLGNGITVGDSITPIFSGADVVMPGESGYLALWKSYGKPLEAAQEISVSADLQAAKAESSFLLDVRHTYIAQNYPGFATVSGAIYNTHRLDCSLNLVYLAFYDAEDKLLGVYHFTKDALIPSGEFRDFVVHLQALPIAGLAENTKTIRAHAFGIE